MENLELRHNSAIDTERWDKTIDGAINSREYAMSWYLDAVWPDWHGIVVDDYAYVMPLAINKKWGFRYAFQPPYSQQHGIYPTATPEITSKLLVFLQKKVDYFHIALNSLNTLPSGDFSIQYRTNLIVSLRADYEILRKNYSKHCLRKLGKATEHNQVVRGIALHDFFELKKQVRNHFESKTDLKTLFLIVSHALSTNRGVVYGSYNSHNELVAAAFFLREKNRWTYLNACSNPDGMTNSSMYCIVDQFIADHSNSPMLLDFEGSMIEGLVRFYTGFGASVEQYAHLHYNNLPAFVRLFKK